MATETNMKEVVERLRAEGSDAILELVDFDRALREFVRTLERMAICSHDLQVAATNIVDSESQDAVELSTVRDGTSRISNWIREFLLAFQDVQSAVQAWSIADPRRFSTLPSSGKRLIPRD